MNELLTALATSAPAAAAALIGVRLGLNGARASIDRIERRLDEGLEKLNDHEVRIGKLEP